MSQQHYSSRSLSGRQSGSAISSGFRGGNSSSSTGYPGAGRCGGCSHTLSGRSLGGYGGSAGGYSAGFRDYSSLGHGSKPVGYGIGLTGCGAGVVRPGGFTSHSAGGYGQNGGFSSQSLGSYGNGYRCSGFSSRSLGGGYGRRYSMVGLGNQSLGSRGICGGGLTCGELGYVPIGRFGDNTGIHAVRVNANLLRPLGIQIDPEISRVKEEEREQIKTLNDQFAGFIDKVRHVEQQNKLLETKWNCLQQQGPIEKKSTKHLFENYIASLRTQLDFLLNEREQLQMEQAKFQDVVEEYKSRYEEEINRRMVAENDFVVLKKDVDCAYTNKVELEVKVEALRQEFDFLRCVHEAEIESLQTTTCDTNVIVSMDNSRELDMEGIMNSVRCQYEEIVQKSKDEVNALYETKYQELQSAWGRQSDNLCRDRREIKDLTRLIQRLKADMENAKKQIDVLQTGIADNEQRGESTLKDAKAKLAEVENALQHSKDELAHLIRDYQELLNVKISLDMEIAMYKSLLEGEESRLFNTTPTNISVVGSSKISVPAGPIYSSAVGGSELGRRGIYGPGSGGYSQRNTSSSGKSNTRSVSFGYKTGNSSMSGGHLSRCSINSEFGQCGTNSESACGLRDHGPVNVGCTRGGGFSSSRGNSSKSGSYRTSGACISPAPCGGSYITGSTGGCGSEPYVSGSSGNGYTTGVGSSAGAGCSPTNDECRVAYGGNCSIIR